MNKKTNFEYIGFYESVTVIIKKYDASETQTICFTLANDYEDGNELKFADVLKSARSHGYRNGTILLILESFLNGKIYRYGNYRDEYWYEVGSMVGFA